MPSRPSDTAPNEPAASGARPSTFILAATFILICLIWGSSWSIVRVGLSTLPVMLSSGLRFILAVVLLAALAAARRIPVPRDARFWQLSVFLGFTAVTVPFALVYWAQRTVDSGLSSIVFATFPFWVALVGRVALPQEPVSVRSWGGMLAGFVGILLISRAGVTAVGTEILLPLIAIVVSAAIQAAALVAIRKHGGPYSPEMLNLIPMIMGALILTLGAWLWEPVSTTVFTPSGIFSIVYLAVFATVICFVGYYWLAKYLKAIYLAMSAFVTPLIAVMIGILFLGESLTPGMILGGILVLAGVLAVTVPARASSGASLEVQ